MPKKLKKYIFLLNLTPFFCFIYVTDFYFFVVVQPLVFQISKKIYYDF